ncbi:MAG: fumarylacetoacetase [Planctomycetota bacterium]
MRSTTDPTLRSFVPVPPESPFPIQNLPYGVFRPEPGAQPRVGVAIGDWVLDLAVLEERGFFGGPELADRRVFGQATLNVFMALGPAAWHAAREQISRLLRHDVAVLRDDAALRDQALVAREAAEMLLPCAIGDYTDFYASREHAANVGRLFRGTDAALPPSYLHTPIGYHGRASSVVISGTDIRRPQGPSCGPNGSGPALGPTRELDFELEVGWFVGRGNELGRPIPIQRAPNQVFGFVLVNDWSARDLQQWEYQPLGPFLGKNFATTISPWVVPAPALEPFRCEGPVHDSELLPYLRTKGPQAYDLHLQVALQTPQMDTPHIITRTNLRHLYWSPVQLVAHHTVGGCNLRPGDLLATGTVSGPTPDSLGCLLELTRRGESPLGLPSGEQRTFLEDGDTIILTGWCEGPDYRLGFGECRGRIQPASP